METANVIRRADHPGMESAHHWLQKDTYDRQPKKNSYQAEEPLPIDPRKWSRTDVARWLSATASRHRIAQPPSDRFPMNGKGLCLMTVEMYLNRVPLGGKLLYRDFQIRLAKAMHMP